MVVARGTFFWLRSVRGSKETNGLRTAIRKVSKRTVRLTKKELGSINLGRTKYDIG